jgi:hypothetical protein
MRTVLPIWAAVFVVCLSAWSIGTRFVTSKQPLVALLAGWALFLVLCSVPWIVGLSANAVRPLFWIFYAAGLWSVVRGRQWTEAATTLVVTGAVAMVLLHRCYAHDGAYVFGAHGTDLWGYVQAADWLTTHSTRELPDLGTSPMRYNWTWYVLATRDRPLVLEAIACCGASTGIDAVKAYLALPVALMATLAIGIGRIPGAFGFGNWLPAVAVAAVMVFHPLPVLHWIAGFAAGSIVGLLLGLTFGAVMAAEPGPARTEALALTVLMLVLCGGLYSPQFMLVGFGLAGALAVVGGVFFAWRHGFRALGRERPGRLTAVSLALAVWLSVAVRLLSGDEFIRSTGLVWNDEVLAHLLGIFGGTSPYAWMFYRAMEPWDQNPWKNPLGLASLAVMVILFLSAAWHDWKSERDLRLPLMVAVCFLALVRVGGDERATMSKAMPIFGLAFVFLLAAVSARLRPRWLGLVAALLCAMPAVRSYDELRELIRDPYISVTDENIALELGDGQNWRLMGFLYYREDSHGFDWKAHPRFFSSMTCFLPAADQVRLAKKHGLPPP